MRFRDFALVVGVAGCAFAAESGAADFPSVPGAERAPTLVAAPAPPVNSVFVFAGAMSSSDIWSTLIFNLNRPLYGPRYDNYIVGAAYGREFWHPGWGFAIGVEIGIADRFGHYRACCFPAVIRSDDLLHSGELWGGVSVGHYGVTIAGVRIKPMIVVGLSAISHAIGAERSLEAEQIKRNAKVLFYVGPELAFSSSAFPSWELVARLHHRSGLYGTLGAMREGYNANVFGARYRF